MDGEDKKLMLACIISGTLFSVLGSASFSILWAVNWRPWRIYSWIYARKWPSFLQGPQLGIVCGFLSFGAWLAVISPIVVLITWGSWLILILGRDIIGLAVIMAGTALLLAFYSIMLWWRTQWQSSRAVAVLLLLAVALLCAYELCAVYVTAGSTAHQRYSPSGFFFGVSAIALAINMLFICRMVFNGNGLDVDEYVRIAYKFAYSDCIEVGPVACLPEPPDPNDLYPRQSRRGKMSRSWIKYNKPEELNVTHAGLLFALGLYGHLDVLSITDIYEYLSQEHEHTMAGLMLGLAASFRGTMQPAISKALYVHIPARHPSSFPELELPTLVQSASLVSVGLLYEGSAHPQTMEILLGEIGRRSGGDNVLEREGYAVSAGISLGLVALGCGKDAMGLKDTVVDRFFQYAGGKDIHHERSFLSNGSIDDHNRSSRQMMDGTQINIDVTAPGAIILWV